jgi:hypothetical protein
MLPQNETHMKPSGVREGSLLFKSVKSGQYVSAPQLNTDVKIEITGMVAYARVIQEFENPGDEWLEGVYVFPLPEDAAVSHLTMDVGDRVIEGVIKEREEAKKVYSQAKKEGKKASLLEQERPNIFMMSLAKPEMKTGLTNSIYQAGPSPPPKSRMRPASLPRWLSPDKTLTIQFPWRSFLIRASTSPSYKASIMQLISTMSMMR